MALLASDSLVRLGWRDVLAAVVLSAVSALAFATSDTVPAEKARVLLEQVQRAAKQLNYEGVFSQQQNGVIHSFRMTHRFDGVNEQERLEVLDNSPREYLRHNHRVQCLMPEHQVVVIESQRQERFPALLMSNLEHFSEHYDLSINERLGRVAGRACVELDIVPKDLHRPHYRLCADQQTRLLLKAQMLEPSGYVMEQIAFSQVEIGHDISDAALLASWPTDNWRRIEREHHAIDFRALGWVLTEPPGYQPTLQIERSFPGGRQVNQMILSDGLASISIFIEPYQTALSHHQADGASRSGSINLYGKRIDDFWVMVVGEVPASTIAELAQSIDWVNPAKSR